MIDVDVKEIESETIAAFICDSSIQTKLKELSEEDFSNKYNRYFFKIMQKMYLNKLEINFATIRNEIIGSEDGAKLNEIIMSYVANFVTSSSIDSNISKLKDITLRKKMRESLKKANESLENFDDVDVIKNTLIKEFKGFTSCKSNAVENVVEVLMTTLEDIEKQKDKKGMKTGFWKLDVLTDGFHENELTCIGARPGTGKTAFALNIATNVAQQNNVLFCSLEMSESQIMQRIIGSYANINTQFLRNGKIKKEEYERLAQATQKIANLHLKIDATTRYVEDIENIIIELKEKNEVDLVVIDYLTLLESKNKYASRELEVAAISRRLKLLALDLHIPIVILVQLNREAENKVPTMANIRESGSIEQNCDNIIFLHIKEQENKSLITNMQVILEKQRQGRTGVIEVRFNKQFSQFQNIEQ